MAIHDALEQFARSGDPGFLAALMALSPSAADASQCSESVSPLAAARNETLAETRIGRYRLLNKIGEGGMGVVYLAEQDSPVRRIVALKIIKPGMDSAGVITRFDAERQALSMMDHPHIARVYDAGATAAGRPYFVMELVAGIPITQYCDEQRLTTRQRLELFLPVCQAIQHAHQKGIIHRDLKPSNLLVARSDGKPVPKVIDFGVARALHQNLTEKRLVTHFGQVIGTLEYMSPEQTEMDILGSDTRSDIYSLGVLLYELLTGSTPLNSNTLQGCSHEQILRTIRETEPPRPSCRLRDTAATRSSVAALRRSEPKELVKLIAGDLDWIIMKCLEKERSRRYETANGLGRDIQRYLQDEPVEASPPSTRYRLRKLARRHRTALRTGVAFVLLLLAATIFSTWQAVQATHARAIAESATTREAAQRVKAQLAERAARIEWARGLGIQADDASLRENWTQAESLYERARAEMVQLGSPTGDLDLGLWALHRRARPPLANWAAHSERTATVVFCNHDRQILSSGFDGTLRLMDAQTGMDVEHWNLPAGISCFFFSADGHRLALAGTDQIIRLWEMPGGREIARFKGPSEIGGGKVALSPDGRRVVAGGLDGSLWIFEADGVQTPRRLAAHGAPLMAFAFSPDGRRGVSGGHDHRLILWDMAAAVPARIREFPPAELGITSIGFSPDGRRVICGTYAGLGVVYDAENGQSLLKLSGHDDVINAVAFTPDGQRCVTTGKDGTVILWSAENGRRLQTLMSSRLPLVSLDVSRDGRRLVAGGSDGRITIWSIGTAPDVMALAGHDLVAWSVCFSRDGRRLASGSWDTPILVRDVATGRLLQKLDRHVNGVRALAFRRDDRQLLSASADGTVILWDVATGNVVKTLGPTQAPIERMSLASNDRDLAVTYQNGAVIIWDLDTGRERLPIKLSGTRFISADFSPDSGTMACVTTGGALLLTNLETGVWAQFEEHDVVLRAAFSPDGRSLTAPVEQARRLQTWDVRTRARQSSSTSMVGDITAFEYNADGSRLLFCTSNGNIGLVDGTSGGTLCSLRHGEAATAVAWTPDGSRIASAGHDKIVRVWDFGGPERERGFQSPLAWARAALANDKDRPWARAALASDKDRPRALAILGGWYALHGADDWAIDCLERARREGATVSSLTLAACYWRLGKFTEARGEFEGALPGARTEDERYQISLCLAALKPAISPLAVSQKAGLRHFHTDRLPYDHPGAGIWSQLPDGRWREEYTTGERSSLFAPMGRSGDIQHPGLIVRRGDWNLEVLIPDVDGNWLETRTPGQTSWHKLSLTFKDD